MYSHILQTTLYCLWQTQHSRSLQFWRSFIWSPTKVNKLKSSILGICVDRTTRAALIACFLYPWATESVSYLGITPTPVTTSLYKANYIPLLNNTHKDLTRLSKYYLSWVGKVTAFKMSIVTKML